MIRYRKSEAVKRLEQMADARFRRVHPDFPEYATPAAKYRDDTANGLTRCVVDFIRFQGFQSERINTTGIPERRGRAVIWRRSTTTRGSADISATIAGRSVKIEVKIGTDRQSEAQKQYARSVEVAGGVYVIARTFEGFCEWYKSMFGGDGNE